MNEPRDGEDSAEFKDVLRAELELLRELDDTSAIPKTEPGAEESDRALYRRAYDGHLAGLALSGGGIRSATFNLGVIQALAKYGLLSRLDYLSTVSGGGFIGGWLSAFLQRETERDKRPPQVGAAAPAGSEQQTDQDLYSQVKHAISLAESTDENDRQPIEVTKQDVARLQTCLKTHPDDHGGGDGDPGAVNAFRPVEHLAVRYLRRYSNYLTPRLGLSGDMFALLSIFARNFLLIQLVLVSGIASLLLLGHVLYLGGEGLAVVMKTVSPWAAWVLFIVGAFALLVATASGGALMASRRHQDASESDHPGARCGVHCSVLPLVVGAGLLLSIVVVKAAGVLVAADGPIAQAAIWALGGALLYALAWVAGFVWNARRRESPPPPQGSTSCGVESKNARYRLHLATLVSGALLGLLLFFAAYTARGHAAADAISTLYVVAFGPPLFILGLSFVVTLHIGLAGRAFSSGNREWLARLGGYALLYGLAWLLVFVLVIYATPSVRWLEAGGWALLLGWITTSLGGAWLAKGPVADDKPGGSAWKGLFVRIAPWLFVVGLAVLVAFATQATLFAASGVSVAEVDSDATFASFLAAQLAAFAMAPWYATIIAALVAIALCVGFTRAFDINLFSLHAMYCNRLARAYLGASRAGERKPNRFSGFDAEDDIAFADLSRQRPIHLINTAINMTGGDDLAWQTRRAASFTFTPQWAGYETRSSQGVMLGGYRPTACYAGGRPLSTLMAISGAAASPNMGYHTSPAVSALLTAFNLRLGRWCGNPDPKVDKKGRWKQASPTFGATPILAELSGSANARADWINLTDGGHFENLGVYELIRRRCRLILVTDTSADKDHQFEDLANMMRKCWTDFGVDIIFQHDVMKDLRKHDHPRHCTAQWMIGCINYRKQLVDPEDRDNPSDGTGLIVYLKASIVGDEDPDIRNYADTHETFPHETTADQFFDENQFEAYRHLGFEVARRMIVACDQRLRDTLGSGIDSATIEQLIETLVPAGPCNRTAVQTQDVDGGPAALV